MKNKKEDTKLYKGIIGLAKTAAGMNCEYGDYQDIKQYFRYPGELLERMEEQGFTSISDYISVMKGLSRIGKYHTDGTLLIPAGRFPETGKGKSSKRTESDPVIPGPGI